VVSWVGPRLMAHLGNLGKQHDAEPLTFDYFGEQVTVTDTFNDIDYLEFLEQSEGEKKSNLDFLRDVSRLLFDDDNYARFWAGRRRGKQTIKDVFDTLMDLIEAASGRPTGLPSDSSDGQQATGQSSAVVSSSLTERLAGRPDLQLVVAQAAEARAAG